MLRKLLDKLRKPGKKGFTLIEVVIVLAIAGLIFVIVFFAVSQAQASRRDTQRRNDADRLVAAASQWSSNHNGQVPDSQVDVTDLTTNYLDDFADPSTGSYTVTYGTVAPDAQGEMAFSAGQKCTADASGFEAAGARSFAVLVFLEKGGVVCIGSGG